MNLEGKLSGQPLFEKKIIEGEKFAVCSCCNGLMELPKKVFISVRREGLLGKTELERNQYGLSYFDTKYFIYESKSGYSALYCSKMCRKHNHRFHGR